MEKEIEIKFDVPLYLNEVRVLSKLDVILLDRGYEIKDKKVVRRNFIYYDTSDYSLYGKGETIRRVGGFDPNKHKGVFRYDIKVGPIDDRYESQIWLDNEIPIEEAVELLGVDHLPQLFPTVFVRTKHTKSIGIKGENLIETSFDQFEVDKGTDFSELELELERGREEELGYFASQIEKEIDLQRSHKQKYSRAFESVSTYQNKLKGGRK